MAAPDSDQPSPPATVVITGLLRLIAAGLEPVETEPYGASRSISIHSASGWWLLLVTDDQGEPAQLTHAQPPSFLLPPWTYGCQRDDWTAGPHARVITPVALLTAGQRQALRERLEAAPVRWQWAPLVPWELADDDELILD